jgi:hypothetical protein
LASTPAGFAVWDDHSQRNSAVGKLLKNGGEKVAIGSKKVLRRTKVSGQVINREKLGGEPRQFRGENSHPPLHRIALGIAL